MIPSVRFLKALMLASVLWPATVQAQGLDVRAWLERPGVRMVAVEFYATWCKPCMKAVPKWKALHEKYRDDGLRLIVVATQDPEGQCVNPGWNPDEIVCDPDGQIARAMSVGNKLPAAFVWSWQRKLLVRRGHVDEVQTAIELFMRRTPRAVVRSKSKELRNLVRSELTRGGKIQIASNKEERAALRELKRRGYSAGFDDKMACDAGRELPPNSVLDVSLTGRGSRQRVALTLLSVESGCVVAAATSPWSKRNPQKSVAEVLDKLVNKMQGAMQLPAGASTSRPPPPIASRGPRFEGGEITNAMGRLRVEGKPRGARIEVKGPGGYKRTDTLPRSIEGLKPGTYTIKVAASGYVTHEETVTVEPDLTATTRIKLLRPGVLHVDGSPRGASVEILAPDGGSLVKKSFPVKGRGLDPGTYTVMVTRDGYTPYRAEHTVKAGETTRVNVRLDRIAKLTGGSDIDISGKWLDKESNTVMTIVRSGDGFRVIHAVDTDDGEVYPITTTRWRNGVLKWEYDVPSTKYHLKFETTRLTGDKLYTKWSNQKTSGTEILYRQSDTSSPVADMSGRWKDTESNTVMTIVRSGSGFRVTHAVDTDDGEVYPITSTRWSNGVLKWEYDVPSTGYHLKFETTRLAGDRLHTKWANQKSSGTEILHKQSGAPPPPPAPSYSGTDISGQWLDKESSTMMTIVRSGSGYRVTHAVDINDNEVYPITRTVWDDGVLEWEYDVPSTGYHLWFKTTQLTGDKLYTKWRNQKSSGTEILYRQGDAPSNRSSPRTGISGKWEDTSTGVVFTIRRRGSGHRMTKILDDDGEQFTLKRFSFSGGRMRFAYYVPSSKTTVTWDCSDIESTSITCKWDNGDANGVEVLKRRE